MDGWTDQQTDRWMDRGRMDTPSYRDARTHLKKGTLAYHSTIGKGGEDASESYLFLVYLFYEASARFYFFLSRLVVCLFTRLK